MRSRRFPFGSMLFCVIVFAMRHSVAADDQMVYPLAVAVAKDQTVYIADLRLPGVWKFADGELSVYFQGSKKFRTPLNAVRCLAIDKEGKLLAGDSATREIYRFDDEAKPAPLTNGNIGIPMSLAVKSDGSIYAGDLEIQRIVKIPAAGGEPAIVAEVTAARGLCFDDQDRLWISSHGPNAILRLDKDDQPPQVILSGRPFQFAHHLAVHHGTVYVADGYARTIWSFDSSAEGAKPAALYEGEPLKSPVGLALFGENLLVADPHVKTIFRLSFDGKLEPMIPAKK
jgi:sugar lactone lactonase YvrE